MSLMDLVPWRHKNKHAKDDGKTHPPMSFGDEFDQMFNGFFQNFGSPSLFFENGTRGEFSPRINVGGTDKVVQVSAELPGIDEKDIDVSLAGDILTIKGEKKESKESKSGDYSRLERRFGSFRRSVSLPCEVESDGIRASFKNGVLNVELPKTEKARESARRIEVTAG